MVGGGKIRQAARAILESVFGVPIHEFKTLMYKGAPGGMQGQEWPPHEKASAAAKD